MVGSFLEKIHVSITSGDGGYDAHFKEIGEKYGPFDIALIEGGQYDRRWSWVSYDTGRICSS